MPAKISESKRQAIIDLYLSGAKYALITSLLGVSKPTVHRVIRGADALDRQRAPRDKESSDSAILAAFRRGASIQGIALEMDLNPETVYGVIREANIPPDVPEGAVAIPEPWGRGYYVTRAGAVYRVKPGKVLIQLRLLQNARTGYMACHVGGRSRYLGEILLTTFVCPRPNGLVVHHKNREPDDDRLENLEWTTRSEAKLAFQ